MNVVLPQLDPKPHRFAVVARIWARSGAMTVTGRTAGHDFIHKPLISRDLLLPPHWKGMCIAISRKHSEALMLVLVRGRDNVVLTRSTYSDEKQLSLALRLRTWQWVEIDALLSAGEVWIGKYFFRLYRGVEMPGTRIREVAPQSFDELLTADDRKFLWAMGVSLARDQRGEEGHDRGSERWKHSAGQVPSGREGCVYRSKQPATQKLTPSLRTLMGGAYEQEGDRNVLWQFQKR